MKSTHQANTGLDALNENVGAKYLVGIDPSILEAKDFTIEKLVADTDNLKAQVALLKEALSQIAGAPYRSGVDTEIAREALTKLTEQEKRNDKVT